MDGGEAGFGRFFVVNTHHLFFFGLTFLLSFLRQLAFFVVFFL